MSEMTVKKIVENYLRTYGYDGLYSDLPCGCELADFMPCEGDQDMEKCEPGYKVKCDCDEGCQFHIVPKKPKGESDV